MVSITYQGWCIVQVNRRLWMFSPSLVVIFIVCQLCPLDSIFSLILGCWGFDWLFRVVCLGYCIIKLGYLKILLIWMLVCYRVWIIVHGNEVKFNSFLLSIISYQLAWTLSIFWNSKGVQWDRSFLAFLR